MLFLKLQIRSSMAQAENFQFSLGRNIYVKRLHPSMDEADLFRLFAQFGQITSVKVKNILKFINIIL